MSTEGMPFHDLAAEQAVLGAMMLSADALAECLDMLTARSFLRAGHQIIFAAIAEMADEGLPVDAVTVRAELERRGELAKITGAPYLHTLIAAVPVAANAGWYGRQLLEHETRREVDAAGTHIQQIAQQPDMTREERIDAAYAALDRASGLTQVAPPMTAADLIDPLLESLAAGPDTTKGVLSGWRDLDEVIPGFRPGEITIVGARPGMGKSVVLLNVAANAAIKQRQTVLAVTLEMSREEYMERLLASQAGVDLRKLRDRTLDAADWDRIAKAHPDIQDAGTLVIEDTPELSVQGIRAKLRAMRRAGRPAALVTIDYLTLVTASGKRSESRQLEVSDISRRLKLLAREFGVPFLVAAALNRGPEQRSDHHPLMADLRESGAVEQDSDIVILLYRDDAYVEDSPHSGEIELIVAKNRQGPKTTVSLSFQGHYATVADMWTPAAQLGGAA
jgi:replicative DNA helicase